MQADETTGEIYDKIRATVLNLRPGDIGVTEANFAHPVFGIVMETGFPEGSFFVASLANGSTNICFSNGGGIVDGGENDAVCEASRMFLSGAQVYYKQAEVSIDFPVTSAGQITFYFIKSKGVVTYTAAQDALGIEGHPLSKLYIVAHGVITALRKSEKTVTNNGNE